MIITSPIVRATHYQIIIASPTVWATLYQMINTSPIVRATQYQMIIASPTVWAKRYQMIFTPPIDCVTFGENSVAFFIIATRLNVDSHEFSCSQPLTTGHLMTMADKNFTKPGEMEGWPVNFF